MSNHARRAFGGTLAVFTPTESAREPPALEAPALTGRVNVDACFQPLHPKCFLRILHWSDVSLGPSMSARDATLFHSATQHHIGTQATQLQHKDCISRVVGVIVPQVIVGESTQRSTGANVVSDFSIRGDAESL